MNFNFIDNLVNEELIKNSLSNDGIVFFNSVMDMDGFKAYGEKLGDIFCHPNSLKNGVTIVKTTNDENIKRKLGNRGFSSSNLFPHTDRSTMLNPPNLLMFYCNEQSGVGGESILIDSKKIFEDIVKEGDEEFIKFIFKDRVVIFDDNITSYKGNIIEILKDGSFFLRFRNDAFSFFSPKYYAFLNHFYDVIDRHKIVVKLNVGHGYIVNNGRFLHGRMAFDGVREMWRLLIYSNFLKIKGFDSEILNLESKKHSLYDTVASIPSDFFANKYPISIKGIIEIEGKIILLKNERDEWELPGGKIDKHENAYECLIREVKEELNITVSVIEIIDTWVYNIDNKVDVFIVTYLCSISNVTCLNDLKISSEHKEIGLFYEDEIDVLNIPEGYKESIKKKFKVEK